MDEKDFLDALQRISNSLAAIQSQSKPDNGNGNGNGHGANRIIWAIMIAGCTLFIAVASQLYLNMKHVDDSQNQRADRIEDRMDEAERKLSVMIRERELLEDRQKDRLDYLTRRLEALEVRQR